MRTFKWRSFTLASFHLFIFALFTCNHYATSQDDVDICKIVYCGMGTCHSTGLLGFRCDCVPGWKNVTLIGSLGFPTCAIPNCTLDLQQCGGPLPKPPPFLNFSNPCVVNFCGDGKCEINGLFDFKCQCNEGSANLLKNPKLPCFKKCTIGADCPDLEIDFPSDPTPPPPPQNSGSPRTDGFGARELHFLPMMILAAIFLNYI